jgi:hypothetical protein
LELTDPAQDGEPGPGGDVDAVGRGQLVVDAGAVVEAEGPDGGGGEVPFAGAGAGGVEVAQDRVVRGGDEVAEVGVTVR